MKDEKNEKVVYLWVAGAFGVFALTIALTTQNWGIALPFGVFALSFVTFGLSAVKKNDR